MEVDRGEGDEFKLDETKKSDALLLGRVTYEGFAAAWPLREGDFADKFNSMPKYVVSSTLDAPEWNNTTVLRGDAAAAVTKLKREHDGNIVVHGSGRLVQTLLEHDLVDELRLMVFPVLLGPVSACSARRARRSAFTSWIPAPSVMALPSSSTGWPESGMSIIGQADLLADHVASTAMAMRTALNRYWSGPNSSFPSLMTSRSLRARRGGRGGRGRD